MEFITLSGTEVPDWCDDELFRRVKDRTTGGEFVAIVVSTCIPHFVEKLCGCSGSDVHGLKGLRPDNKEHVRTETLSVFRCIEVVQIIHSMCMPWVWVLPEFPNCVFQLPDMHVVVQSPGVLERSLAGCDVLVGNIRSLADFVMSGVRESAVVCHERVCFERLLQTWTPS